MGKISTNNIKTQLKMIFLGKGSIGWKLPLILYLLGKFNLDFRELFIKVMLSFTIAKKEPNLLQSETHTTAYADVFKKSFDKYGIDDIIYEIFALLVVLLFATVIDRLKTEDLGMKFSLKSVFLTISGVLISFFAVSLITGALYLNGNLQVYGYIWTNSVSFKNLIPLIIFQGVLFLMVAMQEELFCRAYLMNNLKHFWKPFAVIYASVTFAVLHLGNIEYLALSKYIGILNIFLLAVIFCIYFQRFNDLWLLIGAHFGWNFFMGPFYGMTISDVEKLKGRSILKVELVGKEYWTGEGFGPEGSLFTSFLLLTILGVSLAIIIYKNRRERIRNTSEENKALAL